VSDQDPDLVTYTRAELRVLSERHFEFRDVEDLSQCREARLRPEYAHLYPWLSPDVWDLAVVVVEKVIAGRLQRRKEVVERERLKPRYFGLPDFPWLRPSCGQTSDTLNSGRPSLSSACANHRLA